MSKCNTEDCKTIVKSDGNNGYCSACYGKLKSPCKGCSKEFSKKTLDSHSGYCAKCEPVERTLSTNEPVATAETLPVSSMTLTDSEWDEPHLKKIMSELKIPIKKQEIYLYFAKKHNSDAKSRDHMTELVLAMVQKFVCDSNVKPQVFITACHTHLDGYSEILRNYIRDQPRELAVSN